MGLNENEMAIFDSMAQEIEILKANQGQVYSTPTQFAQPQKQNLVEWQLDFRAELEDIEHLLRNDILKRDGKNEWWARNPNSDEVVFNDRGVNEILKEIRMFLNKNTVLSNYQPLEIRERMKAFGHELRALIYNNYDAYGLDTEYKLNHFMMITVTILQMVESAYRRALNGEERRDLNSARVVNQTDPVQSQMSMMPSQMSMMGQAKQGGIKKYLPWNW